VNPKSYTNSEPRCPRQTLNAWISRAFRQAEPADAVPACHGDLHSNKGLPSGRQIRAWAHGGAFASQVERLRKQAEFANEPPEHRAAADGGAATRDQGSEAGGLPTAPAAAPVPQECMHFEVRRVPQDARSAVALGSRLRVWRNVLWGNCNVKPLKAPYECQSTSSEEVHAWGF
jgi:hypothetical protein